MCFLLTPRGSFMDTMDTDRALYMYAAFTTSIVLRVF